MDAKCQRNANVRDESNNCSADQTKMPIAIQLKTFTTTTINNELSGGSVNNKNNNSNDQLLSINETKAKIAATDERRDDEEVAAKTLNKLHTNTMQRNVHIATTTTTNTATTITTPTSTPPTTVINTLAQIRRTRSAPSLQERANEERQQKEQHENLQSNDAMPTCSSVQINEKQRYGCSHYKRRAMFVTPCCEKFYNCRFCHDQNESHHFDRKTLTELICTECNTRQAVQERCENCGVCFGKYTCLICNLFDDSDKQQYHCDQCGICRIGGAANFFHCAVCDMCLPIQLKIDGHRCVENVSRSHCPVCLGDIHTSRIPCHIPDCGHLLHKMCFDQLLDSGHYTCPTCQTSLIDMTALWEYLDQQALLMPIPHKYENQRIQIFCNDCHQTSKTKFHFIGLKCLQCGAYNTTQDVKRRMSLVTDEPSSA